MDDQPYIYPKFSGPQGGFPDLAYMDGFRSTIMTSHQPIFDRTTTRQLVRLLTTLGLSHVYTVRRPHDIWV